MGRWNSPLLCFTDLHPETCKKCDVSRLKAMTMRCRMGALFFVFAEKLLLGRSSVLFHTRLPGRKFLHAVLFVYDKRKSNMQERGKEEGAP